MRWTATSFEVKFAKIVSWPAFWLQNVIDSLGSQIEYFKLLRNGKPGRLETGLRHITLSV